MSDRILIVAVQLVAEGLRQLLIAAGVSADDVMVVTGMGDLPDLAEWQPFLLAFEFPPLIDVRVIVEAATAAVALVRDPHDQAQARELGVAGVLPLDLTGAEFILGVRLVTGRTIAVEPVGSDRSGESLPAELAERLTPQQRAVAALAARGYSNKRIAAELCCSVSTVKNHLHPVYVKFRLSGRDELRRLVNRAERG